MPDPDDVLITRLIQDREGRRFTDSSTDRGGPTKFGITQATLAAWRHAPMSPAQVSALTEPEARTLYQSVFLEPWAFVSDAPLKELLFDCAVLHGVSRATRLLQAAVGVANDGVIGPETRAAVAAHPAATVYRELLRCRIAFLGEVITADPTQAANAAGWLARVAAFVV